MADNFIMLDRRTDTHSNNPSSSTGNATQESESHFTEDVPPPEDEPTGGLPF
jgi:hypothetical protein